jgi:DnaJ-class molecular chaperone
MRPKTVEDEIVAAGYRALAKERHPDAGGTHERMAELNRAAEALKDKSRAK